MSSVESAQTQIFPCSSLYLFSKSAVSSKGHNLRPIAEISKSLHLPPWGGFPFFLCLAALAYLFGGLPLLISLSSVCSLPRHKGVKEAKLIKAICAGEGGGVQQIPLRCLGECWFLKEVAPA